MTEPNRFIREMYVTELTGIVNVYDQKAPTGAVTPYAVLADIRREQMPLKGEYYKCTTTLNLYHEFNELGNTEALDALSEDVINVIMGTPVIPSFQLFKNEFTGDGQSMVDDAELKTYKKVLRFVHYVTPS